jgi:Xaa-Pro aminopeptidase
VLLDVLITFHMMLNIVIQHGTGHGFGAFLTVHEGPHYMVIMDL